MHPLVEELTFREVGKLATDGDTCARLYWMCLGRLSSTKEYGSWHPEKVHDEIAKVVREVYDKQQSEAVTGEASNDPQKLFPISSIVDYWTRNRAAARLVGEGLLVEYKFSCLMAVVPEPTASKLKDFARKMIPSNILAGDGYEERMHCTIKYGIHSNSWEEVRRVVDQLPARLSGPIQADLGRIEVFTDHPDHDVIVLEVKSEQIRALNELISKKLRCTDIFAVYHPHVSLAYCQKGKGHFLKGHRTFVSTRIAFKELLFTTPAGIEHRGSLAESRVFTEGTMSDYEFIPTPADHGPCHICGRKDELRLGICFECFRQGTNEDAVRHWFLDEEVSPAELAEKPPVWVSAEYRPVWAHLVNTRKHTTYAAAIAHFKRHVFFHNLGKNPASSHSRYSNESSKKESLEEEPLHEFIRKQGGKFCVITHQTGRNMGCYQSKEQAEKRLKQIARFREETQGLSEGLVLHYLTRKGDKITVTKPWTGFITIVHHGTGEKFKTWGWDNVVKHLSKLDVVSRDTTHPDLVTQRESQAPACSRCGACFPSISELRHYDGLCWRCGNPIPESTTTAMVGTTTARPATVPRPTTAVRFKAPAKPQSRKRLFAPIPPIGKEVKEDLDRVCAWCKKSMGTTPAKETGTTHGICDKCSADWKKGLPNKGQVKEEACSQCGAPGVVNRKVPLSDPAKYQYFCRRCAGWPRKTESLLEDDYQMGDEVRNVEGTKGTVIHIHNYGTPAEAYVVRHGQGQIGIYQPYELQPAMEGSPHDAQAYREPTGDSMGRTIPVDDELPA